MTLGYDDLRSSRSKAFVIDPKEHDVVQKPLRTFGILLQAVLNSADDVRTRHHAGPRGRALAQPRRTRRWPASRYPDAALYRHDERRRCVETSVRTGLGSVVPLFHHRRRPHHSMRARIPRAPGMPAKASGPAKPISTRRPSASRSSIRDTITAIPISRAGRSPRWRPCAVPSCAAVASGLERVLGHSDTARHANRIPARNFRG